MAKTFTRNLVALVFATPTLAFGQAQIATGPVTPRDDPWMLIMARIDGGVAIVPGEVTGGYGRISAEGMFTKDPEHTGFVWGFWDAFEGWAGKDAGGFALPVVFYFGYRAAPLVATIGGGLNLFNADSIDDDGGVGIFSPRANARIGVNAGPMMVLATADAQYRWMWGRDDFPLFQFGLSVGYGRFIQEERRR